MIVFVASDKASFSTGAAFSADGGQAALVPSGSVCSIHGLRMGRRQFTLEPAKERLHYLARVTLLELVRASSRETVAG
jgi:hypothetical protein